MTTTAAAQQPTNLRTLTVEVPSDDFVPLTGETVWGLEHTLNEMFADASKHGSTLQVNGRRVWNRYRPPFKAWGNGSLSVSTRSQSSSGTHEVWFKAGTSFVLALTD